MFRGITLIVGILVVGLTLVACGSGESATPTVPPPTATLTQDQILTLADISDDPAATIEDFQPLADYLATNLADLGIERGRVVAAPDFETIISYLESGEVDLYFDSPYPALTIYEQVGAQPLLRRWKKGVGEYHTVIVATQDSGIIALDGLLGHMVAFDDPVSTSGYLLPKAFLAQGGYQMTEKGSDTSAVAADEIGYVFAGDEENVLAWVLGGKTVGAAIPSGDFEALEAGVQSQLTVLARTTSVPRHIALARPGMDQELQTRIVELLLNLHQTPEGQAVLEKFERTSQFDDLPQGPEGTMEALQELFAPVR